MSKLRDAIGETYKVIRGYVPREEAIRLGKELIDNAKNPSTVSALGEAYDEYNYPPHVAILSEKVSYLNELLGEKVLPTYSYSRVYTKDGSLFRHTDRESCEISLSIHLYGDEEWAFGIVDKDGNDVNLILQPGDAVLYDAPYAEHWRNVYTGNKYAQVFHHYVYLNGPHRDCVFDKTDVQFSLRSYIKVLPGFVPAEICDEIIEYVKKGEDRWSKSTTIDGGDGFRVCESYPVKSSDYIDAKLFEYVTAGAREYNRQYSRFNPTQDDGYTILRYFPGGKYDEHTDQHKQYNREGTCIINLNDDYVGGELHHIGSKVKNKLGKGDLVIFPANFMFPHKITPIVEGVRYAMVTWLV